MLGTFDVRQQWAKFQSRTLNPLHRGMARDYPGEGDLLTYRGLMPTPSPGAGNLRSASTASHDNDDKIVLEDGTNGTSGSKSVDSKKKGSPRMNPIIDLNNLSDVADVVPCVVKVIACWPVTSSVVVVL